MTAGPFSGLLVVDFTRVLAGPFCTMWLAELGARVIKIENPNGGDDTRHFVPFFNDRSAYYASLNRGKESIALNLKDDADRQVLLQMVRRADVLVENFRPGTLERLGLGYPELRQLNPRLIYASVSGFGQTGPWSHKPAYDMIVQAVAGLMSLTGLPGGPPMKAGTSVADLTGGLFTVIGIVSSLYHRQRTGEGMRVDVAMLDGLVAMLEHAIMRYAATGETPGPIGNRHPSIAPFEPFATADRPLIVAVGNDGMFSRLCRALGLPALCSDPRYQTNSNRTCHADALQADLEAVLRTQPAQHWLQVLESAGVPCALVHTVADAAEHPQIKARNMIVTAGGLRMIGNPVKLSAFGDPPTRPAAPELDADGERLRKEFAPCSGTFPLEPGVSE